ncbi:putative phospholipase B-like lamina ancestor [Nilaparvata lugens]|uniref:putative phospholipase B-like lamina ancestor n=1 Tax=Nilaparvata lugens TaxID=108931 RepID=UPI00193EAFE8|nr:putative phospholipase B-like lamina ancestor [Nilaparvata lugens]XP_022187926.2 putative phospholipase B-like lamina ancestor [Nilaparvata lugens]
MLKVVGASWSQTRYSSLLIASVALMGMITILFLEFVPRDVYDGRYAATVFWNAQTGFRIEFWGQGNDPRTIRKGVARAYYRPEMLSTGWAVLEIETQPSYPDHVQAHAAGLLEGSLSWQLIYWHWQNTVDSACEGREKFCDEITDFLEDNRDFIREKARLYDNEDPFWHQVNLFYEQLDGLEVGWRYAVKRSRQEDDVDIPRTDFLWLNVMSDILDLEAKKNMSKELITNNRPPLSLALLKLIPGDMTDFILSHATGGYYSSMLRVQKQYKFGLHQTGKLGSALVPGQVMTFTSYPGSVFSQDDFYKVTLTTHPTSSKIVVSGTVLKNLNPESWAQVDASEQVLIGPRVLAANRLARNPEQWAELISKNSSGTGNKQWLVIQPKVTGQGQAPQGQGDNCTGSLTVWIAEQMPGLSRAGDISGHLKDTGYFISYGLPMFKDIQNIGGYHKHERKELTAARLLLQQGKKTSPTSKPC